MPLRVRLTAAAVRAFGLIDSEKTTLTEATDVFRGSGVTGVKVAVGPVESMIQEPRWNRCRGCRIGS